MTTQDTHAARLRQAVESLLEDERLRSNLTDDEARVLLAWGQQRLEEVVGTGAVAPDEEKPPHERLAAILPRVRTAMRRINDLVAEKDNLSDVELQQRVNDLLTDWGQGEPAGGALAGESAAAQLRAASDNQEFIRQLTILLSTQEAGRGTRRPRIATPVQKAPPTPPVHRGLLIAGVVALLLCCLLAVGGYFFLRSPLPGGAPGTPTVVASPTPAAWYRVYFTAPRYPDNPADHRSSLDEQLTAFINSAQTSVDMAIYQLDLKNVTQALLDVKKRGCTVRVVSDVDILDDPKENPSFKQLQAAGITVVGGNPNAIMHDKFVVVDGKAVWTGSWNFTTNDTYRYNNNGILIQSQELARNYTVTFEKMWRDKQFGASRKPGGTTSRLTIGGVTVENYFAPEDGVAEKIIARLKNTQKTIDFMAFSFTDDAIGDVIRAQAKAGVRVRGVFETTGSETQYSEYGRMKAAGLDVLQDGNPYLMHHKVFIIDSKTVIVGSFNFSQNAETANDENLLILDEPALASQFAAEFARVYAQAKNPPKK